MFPPKRMARSVRGGVKARRRRMRAVALLLSVGLPAGAGAQVRTGPGLPTPSPDALPPERVVRVPVPPPQSASPPFLMGFEFERTLKEDGDLAHPGQSGQAVGLRFVFREGRALRQHLAFAHHWEQEGNVSRRGFRLDLISIGFPIQV